MSMTRANLDAPEARGNRPPFDLAPRPVPPRFFERGARMPVQGSLVTMSLTEILQWLGNAGKTGTLSIERNKVVKRILVREGRVIACASQEPADMLGHFLVSRGKISEETLRQALGLQETQRTHLGRIL